MSDQGETGAAAGLGVVGEVLGSLVALVGPWVLLFNLWDAYGFLTQASPEPKHTVIYLVVAVVILTGVVWTFVSARRRGARFVYVWHTLVGAVAVAAITLTVVPQVDWRSLSDPPPVEPNVDYDPCYSGGHPCG